MFGEKKEPTRYIEDQSPPVDPWRFIKAITEKGEDLAASDPNFDKDYNPYQINTLLSRHLDTLAFAHQMNLEMLRGITPRQHFYCLLRMIPKRKRWGGKYPKPDNDEVLKAVSEYAKQNLERSREYIRFLSELQLKHIANSKGGIKK